MQRLTSSCVEDEHDPLCMRLRIRLFNRQGNNTYKAKKKKNLTLYRLRDLNPRLAGENRICSPGCTKSTHAHGLLQQHLWHNGFLSTGCVLVGLHKASYRHQAVFSLYLAQRCSAIRWLYRSKHQRSFHASPCQRGSHERRKIAQLPPQTAGISHPKRSKTTARLVNSEFIKPPRGSVRMSMSKIKKHFKMVNAETILKEQVFFKSKAHLEMLETIEPRGEI